MRELYDEADIYLMSPNIDNMPGSILECFACGLPIVSTEAGGVPYMVKHGTTGLLVRVNDDEGMARAAFRLLEEPGLALNLAKNGLKECERYLGPVIAREWLNLYGRVLDR